MHRQFVLYSKLSLSVTHTRNIIILLLAALKLSLTLLGVSPLALFRFCAVAGRRPFFSSTKGKHEPRPFFYILPLHYHLYEVCSLLILIMRKKLIPDRISEIPDNPRWKVYSRNRKLGATKPPEFALTLCCVSAHL